MDLCNTLKQEMEETRLAFHQLLDMLPESALELPSGNPAWTIGEVIYHMSLAPRFMIADIKVLTNQGWVYRLISKLVPKTLFDRLNVIYTRYGARNLSKSDLVRNYDRAHERAVMVLESLSEKDFQKKVKYPNWDPALSGQVDLERLFHYLREHFQGHAVQIRQALRDKEGIGGV